MWAVYAILSAIFAAAMTILAKMGLKNVPSTLATAFRTLVVLVMAWGLVLLTGQYKDISRLTHRNLIFLAASGAATGLSWLFYFKAVQLNDVSKVAPLDKLSLVFTLILAFFLLHEKLDWKMMVGGGLITVGTFVLIL